MIAAELLIPLALACLTLLALCVALRFSGRGRAYWRTMRPVLRQGRQALRALDAQQRELQSLIDAPQVQADALEARWLKAQGPPPVDALASAPGVGEGTLDLLRRHRITGLEQVRSVDQLTKIKGIGPHKASALVLGKAQAQAQWRDSSRARYKREVFPREHASLIEDARREAARAGARLAILEGQAPSEARRATARALRGGNLVGANLRPDRMPALMQKAQQAIHWLARCEGVAQAAPVALLRAPQPLARDQWIDALRDEYTWQEFEDYIAALWRAQGYTVEQTARAGDHGADVIAAKGDIRWAIECKQYAATTSVSNEIVRSVASHKTRADLHISHACVVTTGRFTAMAREASQMFQVTLIGPDELCALIAKTNLLPQTRAARAHQPRRR